MKTIRIFFPRKLGHLFSVFGKGQGRPLSSSCSPVLIWWCRPEAGSFIKKNIRAQVFSCEFCEIFKNTSGGCFWASSLTYKGFHNRRLYSKACNLTFNGVSKILWTVTVTKIRFPSLLYKTPLTNSSSMLVIHSNSNDLLKTYNIIRTINLINPVFRY